MRLARPSGILGAAMRADLPGFSGERRWGVPPWTISFHPPPRPIPDEVDFAVAGGGFSGLAAAAWLKLLAPQRQVALFEAESLGAGASGRTGGIALAETAAGELPGLGDVLSGTSAALDRLGVHCALSLPGAWELGREGGAPDSPISWADSGTLRVVGEVAGGDVDPGMLVSGLARAADALGALLYENARVENIGFEEPLLLEVSGKQVRAEQVLMATNALSLELSALAGRAAPAFTLAAATQPLSIEQLRDLGLEARKPFYTVDFPYLWGRLLANDGAVFGSGLIPVNDWREFAALDIDAGEAARLVARLERRVRKLRPALRSVEFTHRWGGPILIGDEWMPVFQLHPKGNRVLVLGAYSGHGVALSVYLGCWAAEAMLGRRQLPIWNAF